MTTSQTTNGVSGPDRLLKTQSSDLDFAKSRLTAVMDRLLATTEGGEDTEALRIRRAQDPGPLSRVNAYWMYTLLSIRGRPFPAALILSYIAYVVAVIVFAKYYMAENGELESLKGMKPELKDVTSLLGLAVFLVLAFRNNSAYARWYDGSVRYYELCGAVGNAGRQVAAITPPEYAGDLLWWLFAALFSAKQQLRSSRHEADFSLLEEVMPGEQWVELSQHHDKVQWAMFRYGQIAAGVDLPGKTSGKACEEVMKAANPILAAYNNCWRILRTPMPFAYLVHLRSFLMLWLAFLPWVFVASYGWYTILLCGIISYGILGVEEAAVEVEQPMGLDRNDL
jgi:ion channel-forming bestrophin family protein